MWWPKQTSMATSELLEKWPSTHTQWGDNHRRCCILAAFQDAWGFQYGWGLDCSTNTTPCKSRAQQCVCASGSVSDSSDYLRLLRWTRELAETKKQMQTSSTAREKGSGKAHAFRMPVINSAPNTLCISILWKTKFLSHSSWNQSTLPFFFSIGIATFIFFQQQQEDMQK